MSNTINPEGILAGSHGHRPWPDKPNGVALTSKEPGAKPDKEILASHVYKTYSRQNRVLLEEGQLPKLLQDAILATEDVNFFTHGGIPPLKSIVRALITNIREGRSAEGASTITMQLARDIFKLDRAKKFKRKFVAQAAFTCEVVSGGRIIRQHSILDGDRVRTQGEGCAAPVGLGGDAVDALVLQ